MEIVVKRSDVVDKRPLTSDLVPGELAINTTDGNLYSLVDGEVTLLNPKGESTQVIRMVNTTSAQIDEGVTNVIIFNPDNSVTNNFALYFPVNPVDGQVLCLTFGTEIVGLIVASQVSAIQEPLDYARCDEEAQWQYSAEGNVWHCVENPRRMFVCADGDISSAGSSIFIDVSGIRFTLSYRTSTSSQASMQSLGSPIFIDFRWVGMYNGAIDQGSYDGYTLTSTPVVYDTVIYSLSNELNHNHLRVNGEIWRIHYLISGGGARTTIWAKRVY